MSEVKKRIFAPIDFLKEVSKEMKNVSWPKRSEAMKLTMIVILSSIVVASYIGVLDFVFTNLMGVFLK